METYRELMEMVEEVRSLLDLSEAETAPKGKKIAAKFKKVTAHNPFIRLKKGKRLGPAVRGSSSRPGMQRRYWNCRCRGYQCLCKGAKGEKKTVIIGRSYKNSYNVAYRRWRKTHASKYVPGQGGKWRMSAKDKMKAKLAKVKAKAKAAGKKS